MYWQVASGKWQSRNGRKYFRIVRAFTFAQFPRTLAIVALEAGIQILMWLTWSFYSFRFSNFIISNHRIKSRTKSKRTFLIPIDARSIILRTESQKAGVCPHIYRCILLKLIIIDVYGFGFFFMTRKLDRL